MTATTTVPAPVAARAATPPIRVVAVADSDSYLKWGAATLDRLGPDHETTLLVVRSPIAPTPSQVDAATASTRFAAAPPPVLGVAALRRTLARLAPDVLLVSATGPVAELVCEMAAHLPQRPVLVSGLPGMALPATLKALRFRARCDVLVTHSRRERREYAAVAEALGLSPALALAHLPFLPPVPATEGDGTDRATPEVNRVVFAPQAKVPAARSQRERILVALDDLARARPDVEVVVKLRAAPGEQQTHEEQLPFDALWTDLADAGLVTESHVRFATGPLSDQLVPGSALVTVSSTAVLEAVAAGLPALVIEDFGVNERMLNAAFVGSGCLGSLDDLAAGRFGRLADGWAQDNYLHPEPDDLADVLADLVARRRYGILAPTDARIEVARRRRRRRLLRAALRSTLPRQVLVVAGAVRHPVAFARRGSR